MYEGVERKTVLSLLLLFVSVLAVADGPADVSEGFPELKPEAPKDAPNPCAGLQFQYKERIEQQKIFGFIPDFLRIVTPSQNDDNIRKAIDMNTYVGWKAYKAKYSKDFNFEKDYNQGVPYELRPYGGVLGLMGFYWPLGEFCELAKKNGLKKVTIACDNDVASDERVREHNGKTEVTESNWVITECFVSTYPGKSPSWDDLKKSIWGKPIKESQYADNPDAILSSDLNKQLLYFPLVNRAISWIVAVDHDNKKAAQQPKAAALIPNDVSNCLDAQKASKPTVPGLLTD